MPAHPCSRLLFARVAAVRAAAVRKAAVREAFELDSEQIAILETGDVIEVHEHRRNENNQVRIRTGPIWDPPPDSESDEKVEGWTSITSRDGNKLMVPVQGDGGGDKPEEEEVDVLMLKAVELMDQMFASLKQFPEDATLAEAVMYAAKSFLKVSVVAFLVYRAIEQDLPRFAVLPAAEPENAAAEVGSIAGRLVIQGMLILSALAGFDYFLAWRKFKRESKMTKHEIREEHKHQEGDPHLKAKRRGKQRELSKNRAVTDVRNATCLVTNPTHIAVALRYEPDLGDPAPMMLCQGVDEIALRMRAAAREHGIPILENKPLARALRASGKVGQPIPFDLYEAAARVIAHVMTIRRGASV